MYGENSGGKISWMLFTLLWLMEISSIIIVVCLITKSRISDLDHLVFNRRFSI